uniref:Uncharacterized protein n=1 Tax=Haptolina brevifila TaxID=156173 RepID=A0A7S2IW63_9EUKA
MLWASAWVWKRMCRSMGTGPTCAAYWARKKVSQTKVGGWEAATDAATDEDSGSPSASASASVSASASPGGALRSSYNEPLVIQQREWHSFPSLASNTLEACVS